VLGVAAVAVLAAGVEAPDAVAAVAAVVPAPAELSVPPVGVGAAPVAAVGDTVGSAVKATVIEKVNGHAPAPPLALGAGDEPELVV
jgi:hypothetical protein